MPEWAVDAVLASEALGALIADLRRAEANGHDLDRVLPRIVAERGFGDADDPARILHYRLGPRDRWTRQRARTVPAV